MVRNGKVWQRFAINIIKANQSLGHAETGRFGKVI
jgi:hypothetical protein